VTAQAPLSLADLYDLGAKATERATASLGISRLGHLDHLHQDVPELDLANLTEEQLKDLQAVLDASPFTLWAPNPGPQALAYASPADELFYGGAAGGGKTGLLIGLALTQHQRSLIIRRESTQLRGFIDDVARIIRTRDGLNKQDGQWRIPRHVTPKPIASSPHFNGQLIEFGGVPNPGDEERHQGIPHDLLAFDEATQLPEYIIDYLSSWCRSTDPNQRTRIVLTSNPPTPSTTYKATRDSSGGQWLIRRYAPWLDPQYRDPHNLGPARPGELRYFVTINQKEQEWPDATPFEHVPKHGPRAGQVEVIIPRSRTFIPALPTDNPYLGSDYIATLQKHPEPLRSALLYGDFSVSLSDRPMQLFPSEWVRAATQRHRDTQVAASATGTADPTHNRQLTCIGVDVARGGTDSTVICKRYDGYYAPFTLVPGHEAATGPDVASKVLAHRRDNCPLVIDANGIGASVYDHLRGALNLDNVVGYVGSRKSLRTDKSNKLGFVNLRSERYWVLREALDPSSQARLAIPDDPELIEELLAMTWEEQNTKIKVIPKKDLTQLLGRSPDKADALILASMPSDLDTSDDAMDHYYAQRATINPDADGHGHVYTHVPTREESRTYSRGGPRLGRRPARPLSRTRRH